MLDHTVCFTKPVRASHLLAAANGLVAPSFDPLDTLSPAGAGNAAAPDAAQVTSIGS